MKITFTHTDEISYLHCAAPDGTPGDFEFRTPGDYEVPASLGEYLIARFPKAFSTGQSKAMSEPSANKSFKVPARNK